jgi:hypothetical protein
MMQLATARTSERDAFYERNGGFNKAPLWDQLHGLVTARPEPRDRNFRRYLKTLGLITMVGVSANLALPVGKAQAGGDFTLSCVRLRLNSADFSNTAVLTANCIRRDKSISDNASINLNDYIADDQDGNMQRASHGHFQRSCLASALENPFYEPDLPTNLFAYCFTAAGYEKQTDLNLNEHIANIDGNLTFVP